MKKPDTTTSAKRTSQTTELGPTLGDLSSDVRGNFLQQIWAKVRSWFEIPYGYEDETGFHYGHEPVPVQTIPARPALREVFTDRVCDTAMFMTATSSETSPAPTPEKPLNSQQKRRETVNPS